MQIERDEQYRVIRFSKNETRDYGTMLGQDVLEMIKNCEYNSMVDMWFTKNAKYGYSINRR